MIDSKCFKDGGYMCKRIEWIDEVKGIGILLVMFSHMYSYKLLCVFFSGYILLFFIASGLTYKNKGNDFVAFITNKIKRLIIPFLFYGFWSIVINCILKYDIFDILPACLKLLYGRFSLFVETYNDNVYFMESNPPLWFLPAMFLSFLLLYVYEKMTLRYQFLFLVIGMAYTIYLSFCNILLPWSADTIFVFFFGFIIGIKLKNIKFDFPPYFIAMIFVLFAYITFKNGMPNLSIRHYGNYGVLSILLYPFIGLLEFYIISYFISKIKNNIINVFLGYSGRHALRLMCIHYPIFSICKGFCCLQFNILHVILIILCVYGFDILLDFLYRNICQNFQFVKYL